MKRVQSICGKTIFEARTIRDFNTYDCPIGSYNIYVSAEVRNLGIAYSTPEYTAVESLAEALELCGASNRAIADALADELSSLDYHDADLASEIATRLEIGDTICTIRATYDRENGVFHDNIEQDMIDEIREIAVRVRDEANCRIHASGFDEMMYRIFWNDWYAASNVISHCDAGTFGTSDRLFAKMYGRKPAGYFGIRPAAKPDAEPAPSRDELVSMINAADSIEELDEIRERIRDLDLPDDLREEIEMELAGSYDMFHHREWFDSDYGADEDYGPSNPWDAPGMRISDFITGVTFW
jgi:hypothetical protein